MQQNKKPEGKDPAIPEGKQDNTNEEAVRGKKAIKAGKLAAGEDSEAKEVKKKEKKDAENWRNEG